MQLIQVNPWPGPGPARHRCGRRGRYGGRLGKAKYIGHHRYRAQAHGQRRDHRAQQQAEHWVKNAGGDRHSDGVVGECKPEVLFHVANRATGVIEAIDPAARTITNSHGPVPTMAWPAMTMTFKAQNVDLAGFKVGDRITFEFSASGMTARLTPLRDRKSAV